MSSPTSWKADRRKMAKSPSFNLLPSSPRRRNGIVRYIVAFVLALLVLHQLVGFDFPLIAPLSSGSPRRARAKIQHDFGRTGRSLAQPERLKAVKREFSHVWKAYQDHGWMADQLRPLNGDRFEQFCGWSATLVDTLDTLWIMDLKEEWDQAVNATTTIDFAHSHGDCTVSLFESTIRYLGGILGAYDLSHDRRLLPKIVELGDTLHSAFQTETGLPCFWCRLGQRDKTTMFDTSRSASLADMGSLTLEFARLSQITGDEKYQKSAMKLIDVLEQTQNQSSLPGLWPESIVLVGNDPENPLDQFAMQNNVFSLGALSDSTYEYLVKSHLLLGGATRQFSSLWDKAVGQIRRHLIFRGQIPRPEKTHIFFPGTAHGTSLGEPSLEARVQHLACFAGGMFAMAGRMFHDPADEKLGAAITNACVWGYENGPLGMMPETFTALPCPNTDGEQCAWNQTYWDESRRACLAQLTCNENDKFPDGFLHVPDQRYLLRPEAIESVFILWRMTGNERWREVGWKMFESIIAQSWTPYGHAALHSVMHLTQQNRWLNGRVVTTMEYAQQDNEMESFWMAETLKYFYLLFADTGLVDLDEFVLNTEAHPLKLTDGIRGF